MEAKTALIIGSDGSEEMELIITADVLRRGDVDVTIAGLQNVPIIECKHKARVAVDKLFKEVQDKDFDLVVVLGGPGHEATAKSQEVGELLRRHEKAGKLVASACTGAFALAAHGIGGGKATMTTYPPRKDDLTKYGYTYSEDGVVVWNNVVTSRGPGKTFELALKLVETLQGAGKAQSVREAVLLS
ncbi:DJR-1.1 protein [Aphelenchoides avenae]|nr:DJR-1.1 protein [Aphelenchus avenae]